MPIHSEKLSSSTGNPYRYEAHTSRPAYSTVIAAHDPSAPTRLNSSAPSRSRMNSTAQIAEI
jgi:hypothetical protein